MLMHLKETQFKDSYFVVKITFCYMFKFARADVFVDSFLKLAERASSNFMGH